MHSILEAGNYLFSDQCAILYLIAYKKGVYYAKN